MVVVLVVVVVFILVLVLVLVVVVVFILVVILVLVLVLEFLVRLIHVLIRIQGVGYSGSLARGELADVHNNNLSRSTMTTSHMMLRPLEKITSVGIIIMISSLKLRSRSHS